MKRNCILVSLLAMMVFSISGCSLFTPQNPWQQNVEEIKENSYLFSKIATKLLLSERDMPENEILSLKVSLVALKDLLEVPGEPNFDGAKLFVQRNFQENHKVYGLAVIDVLERFVTKANLNLTTDQELIMEIISSVLKGALDGIDEFVS